MEKLVREIALTFACLAFSLFCYAQKEIRLYDDKIPNSRKCEDKERIVNSDVGTLVSNVTVPTLTVFLPDIKGQEEDCPGIIICPGGGYHLLLIDREGRDIARAFNEFGVAAFVLKYRLPDDHSMGNKSICPLQDVQQAIKTVRQRAAEWKLDSQRIGIMGFSAGGHLAATAGTHFNQTVIDNNENISLKPDFMILVYPVISFTDSIGHIGSRNFLLGETPDSEQVHFFSNEYHVNRFTPPTFIVHANDDTIVPVENSLFFFNALRKNSVPAELHIYSEGGHGFLQKPSFPEWFGQCEYWLRNNNFTGKSLK